MNSIQQLLGSFAVKVFEKKTFERFYDQDSGAVFSDLEFRDCVFQSCAISMTQNPRLRSTIRNIKLINCEEVSCYGFFSDRTSSGTGVVAI
jgi:hypothetical protein